MQQENPQNSINFNEGTINLREELEKYLFYWKWIVLGVIISVLATFFYVRYMPNLYKVSTTILIDDRENGGASTELSALEDLGLLGGGKASIDNEIELLKSRNLMERVAKDLQLNIQYYSPGRVIESELFFKNAPVKINFLVENASFYNLASTLSIQIKSTTEIELTDREITNSYSFGQNIETSLGNIIITPNDIDELDFGNEIIIKAVPLKSVVDSYRSRIQIQPVKNSSVLKISLVDRVKLKAEEILNNLVTQYNKDAIEDKGLIATNTNKFINERIEIINKDLSIVETNAEQFKSSNSITDIASEASLVLQNRTELEKGIIDLSTQQKLADYIGEYIQTNKEELLPVNLGFKDASINESTTKYNELILERNRILRSSSKQNPVIVNIDSQVMQLRGGILQSLVNLKSTLGISLKTLKTQENLLNSKIAAVPKQEREYRNIERQQQIIEALYLYLLQKREENAISLAVTLPNAKIIDKAYGSNAPVAPKRNTYYMGALMAGIVIPIAIIYLLLLLDNKVHTRKDVEEVLRIPILGDIPKSLSDKKMVVSDNNRNSAAESFRLLRTNINFMLSKVKDCGKVIFTTSTLSGEGKTFISINLSVALALSNKKVLLIGADIRKPKISEYLNTSAEKGLTHYLIDESLDIEDVITTVDEGFDLLHSGIIPPNPSELLMNGRFEEAIEYGKENYDYVIVDTAPVNIVTDTLLLGQQADLCIYVVRANFLDKRLLDIPKLLYNEKRLPNMAVLVNDINFERGYGYGYGYGYEYVDTSMRKSWWKKMLKDKS